MSFVTNTLFLSSFHSFHIFSDVYVFFFVPNIHSFFLNLVLLVFLFLRFENDRTISFIPPDGEFELMNYRLATQVKPLIWVETVVESHSRSRIEYMIKAKSQFKSRSIANNVEIMIPVPPDVDSPSFKASIGTVTYIPDKDW